MLKSVLTHCVHGQTENISCHAETDAEAVVVAAADKMLLRFALVVLWLSLSI